MKLLRKIALIAVGVLMLLILVVFAVAGISLFAGLTMPAPQATRALWDPVAIDGRTEPERP